MWIPLPSPACAADRPASAWALSLWSGPVVAWALALVLCAGPALAQNGAALVRVDQVTVQPMDQTIPVLGRLVPRQSGVVAARIDGPLESFRVEVGDRVEAGQVIALLNVDTLQARRDLAAGQLAEAKAQVATRKAALTLARQEAQRIEGLKTSAAFSQGRHDDAQQQVAMAHAEVAEAQANVQTHDAELRLAEINLRYAEVVAPYAGVISQRLTEAGAFVRMGDPIVSMIGDGNLEIEAEVPARNISGLERDTAIRVSLDDGSGHWAVVRALVPEENPLTRTRTVRLVPEFGETAALAAEQSVTLHVPAGAPRSVVSVHKDAVIKRGAQSLVFVVANDSAELRPVRLGEAVGSRLEVLEGLSDGELVVVRGNERLQPGDKVSIDKES
jgi:RND family efflux transporter MFP subunit